MNFSTSVRRVAALSAAGLAASVFAAVPADAAVTGLTYSCKDPLGTPRQFTVAMDTNAPATINVGESFTPTLSATVSVDNDTRDLLVGVEAKTIEGATAGDGKTTSTLGYAVNGTASQFAATVPVTAVDATKQLDASATAVGGAVTATAVGDISITAGDFTAVLAGKKADGSATLLSPYTIPCVLNAGQNAVIDTVTVTEAPAPAKVDSTTTAKVKYAKKAKKATVKVAVKGADGTPGTGKVKVKVKIGKKTKTVSAKLNAAGKAKAVFKKLGKGKYKFAVSYAGADNQNASKAKAVLKVK